MDKTSFPRARELVSERAQRSAQANQAARSERLSERCERTNERTSDRPSTQRVYSPRGTSNESVPIGVALDGESEVAEQEVLDAAERQSAVATVF